MKIHTIGALILSSIAPLPAFSMHQGPQVESTDGGASQPREQAVNPPKVGCHGNTLSISASNSRLGAILSEIQKCTGLQFDAPEDAKSYLVFDEIEPGTSSNVLTALLTSSGFNYLIGTSSADPEKVEHLVLLNRTNEKDSPAAGSKNSAPLRKAFEQMREAARPKTPEMQAAIAEVETAAVDSSAPPQATVAATETNPSTANPDAAKGTADGNATTPEAPLSQLGPEAANPSKPATPAEERIASMEKLFEQRRKMNEHPQASPQTQSQSPAPQ